MIWTSRLAGLWRNLVHRRRRERDLDEEVRAYAASKLRSSRAPSSVLVWPELPYTPTGKLLRRDIIGSLTEPADG